MQIRQVHLRTADLQRALRFYNTVLGMKLIQQSGASASLSFTGKEPALLLLTEDREAPARNRGSTGLFHVAFLYPSRKDLALAVLRLAKNRHPIDGASDHLVSEAIYLRDPDHNGIELYADRPQTEWVWRDGQVEMATFPLDIESLLGTAANATAETRPSPSTRIGHIHLQVASLPEAERFYRELLGLAVTQRDYPGALFFSAGGYHHHIAANTWGGKSPLVDGSIGLLSYRISIPDRNTLAEMQLRAQTLSPKARPRPDQQGTILRLQDPSGVWLEVE